MVDASFANLALVKSTYEGASSQENGRNLQQALSFDATWTEARGFPYAGTYTGFEAIAQNVFRRLAQEWIGYKVVIEDYVASGDRVVAYGTYSGVHKETGKAFEARVAHLWKVVDGRIVSFEQFVDSVPVVEAMG
jgi:uncharacterized protein